MTSGDWPIVAVAFLAGLLGGVVRGATGFGGALVMIPFLAAVLPPPQAVALVVLAEAAGYLHLLRHAWREIRWRRVAPMAGVAVAAMPLGVFVPSNGNPT